MQQKPGPFEMFREGEIQDVLVRGPAESCFGFYPGLRGLLSAVCFVTGAANISDPLRITFTNRIRVCDCVREFPAN